MYRSPQFSQLYGKYLCADIYDGIVWALEEQQDGSWTDEIIATAPGVAAFGTHPLTNDLLISNVFNGQIQVLEGALTGSNYDFDVSVEVLSLVNTNDWAKAGIMVRESTDANAPFAMLLVAPSSNGRLDIHARSSAGANAQVPAQAATSGPPRWLRMQRVDGIINCFYSSDGTNWTQLGGDLIITMTDPPLVGLAVTSHSDGNLTTAVFDNLGGDFGSTVILDNGQDIERLEQRAATASITVSIRSKLLGATSGIRVMSFISSGVNLPEPLPVISPPLLQRPVPSRI